MIESDLILLLSIVETQKQDQPMLMSLEYIDSLYYYFLVVLSGYAIKFRMCYTIPNRECKILAMLLMTI